MPASHGCAQAPPSASGTQRAPSMRQFSSVTHGSHRRATNGMHWKSLIRAKPSSQVSTTHCGGSRSPSQVTLAALGKPTSQDRPHEPQCSTVA